MIRCDARGAYLWSLGSWLVKVFGRSDSLAFCQLGFQLSRNRQRIFVGHCPNIGGKIVFRFRWSQHIGLSSDANAAVHIDTGTIHYPLAKSTKKFTVMYCTYTVNGSTPQTRPTNSRRSSRSSTVQQVPQDSHTVGHFTSNRAPILKRSKHRILPYNISACLKQ